MVELESGSKVIDSYGNVKEAKTLLVPTKLKDGKLRESHIIVIGTLSVFFQRNEKILYLRTRELA